MKKVILITISVIITFTLVLPTKVYANPEALQPCYKYVHYALNEYHIRYNEYPNNIQDLIDEGKIKKYKEVDPYIGNFSGCSGSIMGVWDDDDYNSWDKRYVKLDKDRYLFDGNEFKYSKFAPIKLWLLSSDEDHYLFQLCFIPPCIFTICFILLFTTIKLILKLINKK